MTNTYSNEINKYRLLNQLAQANGTSLVGSTFFNSIPVNELKQTYSINCNLYNRSINDLTISAAKELVAMTITDIKPNRILLQLGETDLEQGYLSIDEMMTQYSELIKMIKAMDKHCKIVLVSVCENEYRIQPAKFNSELSKLASTFKCQFADISSANLSTVPQVKAFRSLRYFMTGSFSLSDAFDTLSISEEKPASMIGNNVSPSLT